ncbi:MAG: hypothetical protein ACLRNW_21510 [Neglectibacter sp.]
MVKLVFDFKDAPNMKNESFNAYFKVDSVASKSKSGFRRNAFPGTGTTIVAKPDGHSDEKAVVKLGDANGNKYGIYGDSKLYTGNGWKKVKISDIIGKSTTIAEIMMRIVFFEEREVLS